MIRNIAYTSVNALNKFIVRKHYVNYVYLLSKCMHMKMQYLPVLLRGFIVLSHV